MDEDIIHIATNSDGMHRCLRVTEIQAQIFGWLRPSDCTQLALTCASFYDSACDIVWAEVETMVHFARCMPPEALMELEVPIYDYVYSNPDNTITNLVSLLLSSLA